MKRETYLYMPADDAVIPVYTSAVEEIKNIANDIGEVSDETSEIDLDDILSELEDADKVINIG